MITKQKLYSVIQKISTNTKGNKSVTLTTVLIFICVIFSLIKKNLSCSIDKNVLQMFYVSQLNYNKITDLVINEII